MSAWRRFVSDLQAPRDPTPLVLALAYLIAEASWHRGSVLGGVMAAGLLALAAAPLLVDWWGEP